MGAGKVKFLSHYGGLELKMYRQWEECDPEIVLDYLSGPTIGKINIQQCVFSTLSHFPAGNYHLLHSQPRPKFLYIHVF